MHIRTLFIAALFFLSANGLAQKNKKPAAPANSFDDYVFTAPDKWLTQKNRDFILLAQSQEVNSGCVIQILLPTASTGNLEQDAINVFNTMYAGGWQFRQAGEKQYDLAKGHTTQGLEYCMMEAPMQKPRPDGFYFDYEDGSALVIGVGKQIAIIAGRHNRLLSCECKRKYDLWKRFFKSFTVKNTTPPKKTDSLSQRIIGFWKTAESMVVSDYVFAANGHFQHGGAIGSTSTSRDRNYEYIHMKSWSFEGDGSYSVENGILLLKKKGTHEPQRIPVRFEMVNHGGTGWKEKLYMLGKDVAGEFESSYEKKVN